jgi:hypothetical protein
LAKPLTFETSIQYKPAGLSRRTGELTMKKMVSVRDRSQDDARLLFHRYGRRYFLVQAWAGGNTGLQLPMTHSERSVVRELTRMKPIKAKPETIVLAARR